MDGEIPNGGPVPQLRQIQPLGDYRFGSIYVDFPFYHTSMRNDFEVSCLSHGHLKDISRCSDDP